MKSGKSSAPCPPHKNAENHIEKVQKYYEDVIKIFEL